MTTIQQTRELDSVCWKFYVWCLWSCDLFAFQFKAEVVLKWYILSRGTQEEYCFWSYSQYTCQIYFAFLKKLYYLYLFFKSVTLPSMFPKANILMKRVMDFTITKLKLLSVKIHYKQDWKAIENWEQCERAHSMWYVIISSGD